MVDDSHSCRRQFLLTGIAPVLTPIAASALALLQVLAFFYHVAREKPTPRVLINVLLVGLALFVAIARFSGV